MLRFKLPPEVSTLPGAVLGVEQWNLPADLDQAQDQEEDDHRLDALHAGNLRQKDEERNVFMSQIRTVVDKLLKH